MALPYLFFGFVYRGLWLPQHQGHLKTVVAAPSVNINTAFYCEPFEVIPPAMWGCEALVSVLPFLHGNNTAQCLEHVYPSDTHLGAYRLGCAGISAWLGPTWLEFILQLAAASASYVLKVNSVFQ